MYKTDATGVFIVCRICTAAAEGHLSVNIFHRSRKLNSGVEISSAEGALLASSKPLDKMHLPNPEQVCNSMNSQSAHSAAATHPHLCIKNE